MVSSGTLQDPRLRLAAWLSVGGLIRLRAVPPTVGDVDGVNFATALVRFDPLTQAPHLPGYAPYVAAAKAFAALGAPEALALALPGVIAWVLGAWLFTAATRAHAGDRVAELALVALALLPGAALFGGWPTSDGFGLGLWLAGLGAAGLAAARPRWALLAGAFGGLLIASRLSWWPLIALPALWALARPNRARAAALVAIAVGALTGLLPLLIVLGPSAALEGLLGFGAGHFSTWGGAADLGGRPDLLARLHAMSWGLYNAMLGGWSPGAALGALGLTAVMGAAGWGLIRRGRGATPAVAAPLAAVTAAYLGWVLLGQNVDKPRHLLPLVPLLALGLALGLSRARPAGLPAWLLAGALALVTVPRAVQQAHLGPAPTLVQYVLQNHSPQGLQIFAGEPSRVFEHLAPQHRVWRPASPEVLRTHAARAHAAGVEVLVVSGARGWQTLQPHLTELERAPAPATASTFEQDLVLYRYEPEASGRLHANR